MFETYQDIKLAGLPMDTVWWWGKFPAWFLDYAPRCLGVSPVGASQVELVVKNPPANAGDTRDTGLIPGPRRSPGRGKGNPCCVRTEWAWRRACSCLGPTLRFLTL